MSDAPTYKKHTVDALFLALLALFVAAIVVVAVLA